MLITFLSSTVFFVVDMYCTPLLFRSKFFKYMYLGIFEKDLELLQLVQVFILHKVYIDHIFSIPLVTVKYMCIKK